jgi:D-beta-D-heptose 7-phosphate kinase / D-beta-D-heptose 1-phosphate adenosyltransferase
MNNTLNGIIDEFSGQRIIVIGDLMLDVYLKGNCSRLTPDAPVPVVNVLETVTVPGGAANTAANLAYLGAAVTFCTVTGKDEDEKNIRLILESKQVACLFITDQTRETIVKTRVMAGQQLITRFDKGTENEITADAENRLITMLSNTIGNVDAIIVSDYEKGVLTPRVIDALNDLNAVHNKFLAVDARRPEKYSCLSPGLIKPNYAEAAKLLQLCERPTDRIEQIMELGDALYSKTNAAITALTLDEDGAVIFEKHQPVYQAKAPKVNNPHVSGAGDAYISAFLLSLLSGGTAGQSAEIAAVAAMIAIGKCDTAHCLQQELVAAMLCRDKQLHSLKDLQYLCEMYRQQGKKIVFTNGCFDILHSGHVTYLNQASSLGDVLIVGINKDDSIARLKGPTRPINQLQDRMAVLAALGGVTHIIAFGDARDDTPAGLINVIQPDIFVKGGDYAQQQLPEAGLVEALGGKVMILPLLPDRSTTRIISQIHNKPVLKLA